MKLGVSIILNVIVVILFFFQAKDGIRDSPYFRGLGDVYRGQLLVGGPHRLPFLEIIISFMRVRCPLYTTDPADE